MNYHFSKKKAFETARFAYIPSYIFSAEQSTPQSEEHRIWQQFILTNKIGRVKCEHCYRVEERWISADFKIR